MEALLDAFNPPDFIGLVILTIITLNEIVLEILMIL